MAFLRLMSRRVVGVHTSVGIGICVFVLCNHKIHSMLCLKIVDNDYRLLRTAPSSSVTDSSG